MIKYKSNIWRQELDRKATTSVSLSTQTEIVHNFNNYFAEMSLIY